MSISLLFSQQLWTTQHPSVAVTTQVIVVAQHDTSGEMTIITADSGSRKESGWHKNNKREAYKKTKKKRTRRLQHSLAQINFISKHRTFICCFCSYFNDHFTSTTALSCGTPMFTEFPSAFASLGCYSHAHSEFATKMTKRNPGTSV